MTKQDGRRGDLERLYAGPIIGIVFGALFCILGAVTGFGLWWSSAGLMVVLSLTTGFMIHRRGSIF